MSNHEDDESEVLAVMDEIIRALPESKRRRIHEARTDMVARARRNDLHENHTLPTDVSETLRQVRQHAVDIVVYRHGVFPARWRFWLKREAGNPERSRPERSDGHRRDG